MKKDSPNSWIEKNIEKMMIQISQDARFGRPLPLFITLHPVAYTKFVEILKSKSSFFPDSQGFFSFLTVPVRMNPRLPYGTFTVERFKEVASVK